MARLNKALSPRSAVNSRAEGCVHKSAKITEMSSRSVLQNSKTFLLLLATSLSLCACNEQKNSAENVSANDSSYTGRSYSVLGQLRPKQDPDVLRQIQAEEEAQRQAKIAEIERQQRELQQANSANNPMNRNLPSVDTGPISGGLQPVNNGLSPTTSSSSSMPDSSGQSWAAPVAPPPPQAASYGINYSNPSPGFVPPPPAVSLSTSAVPMPMPYGAPPPEYANPYAYMQQPQQQGPPQRQPGGLFGTSSTAVRNGSSDDDDDSPRKKKIEKPMQIITPTGMESRSPFKQRDEIRMLWKGALASSLAGLNNDGKFAEALSKIDVGLPGEASKGSLSVPQRQIDNLFKNTNAVDKKIYGTVKKTQTDLVQAYYRYLYSYNKYFLSQQQVAARKQELDAAESQTEKQRATVDLSNAQQDADSSKDDMRSAQSDLASLVGAPAARTVIQRVSGVSPSLDSLAADSQPQAQDQGGEGGFGGGILNVFGFGKKSSKEDRAASDAQQVASAETRKGKDKKEKKEKEKDNKDKKKSKGDEKQIAAKPAQDSASSSKADATETAAAPSPPTPSSPVSFELKDVKTTPRKSVLRVVVKNTGGDNFNFDADSVSVAEGNNKLADASVNAEFDSTIVQPSQEVTGTITIFGRPWNDKITVSLSNGKKPIMLHR